MRSEAEVEQLLTLLLLLEPPSETEGREETLMQLHLMCDLLLWVLGYPSDFSTVQETLIRKFNRQFKADREAAEAALAAMRPTPQ